MYVVAQSHLCLYILHAVYHTYVPYQRGLFEPKTIHLANGACGNAYLIQPCFCRVPSSGRPVVAIQQKKTSPTKFQQFSILQLAKKSFDLCHGTSPSQRRRHWEGVKYYVTPSQCRRDNPGRPGQSLKEWSGGCGNWKMTESFRGLWGLLGL